MQKVDVKLALVRALFRDSNTSPNLQEHSFEALASSDQDQGQYI